MAVELSELLARSFDDAEEFFQAFAGWLLTRECPEESGQLCGEGFVFEDLRSAREL